MQIKNQIKDAIIANAYIPVNGWKSRKDKDTTHNYIALYRKEYQDSDVSHAELDLYVSNDGALHIYVQLFFHDKVRDDFDFVWDKQIDKLDGLIEFFTIKIPQRKNKEQSIERAAISAFYAEIGNENCHNWEIPIKQDIIKRLRVVCMILAYMCDEYVSNKT